MDIFDPIKSNEKMTVEEQRYKLEELFESADIIISVDTHYIERVISGRKNNREYLGQDFMHFSGPQLISYVLESLKVRKGSRVYVHLINLGGPLTSEYSFAYSRSEEFKGKFEFGQSQDSDYQFFYESKNYAPDEPFWASLDCEKYIKNDSGNKFIIQRENDRELVKEHKEQFLYYNEYELVSPFRYYAKSATVVNNIFELLSQLIKEVEEIEFRKSNERRSNFDSDELPF